MLKLPANALVALGAAATWGGGDFSGGMAVKAAGGSLRGALRVIVLAHFTSFLILLAVVALQAGSLPHGAPLVWSLGAGVAAGLSLTAFYLALAQGVMGASAAISGLLAAAIPVAVSAALEGAPGWLKASGFAVALLAIWLIAAGEGQQPSQADANRKTMMLAVIGGVGFGIYFVGLQRANALGVFEPIMLARAGSILICLLLLLALGRRSEGEAVQRLSRAAYLWAGGIALLDTSGNLLFIAATRLGRLDVAAMLASLYPASTILLAAWWLHERPTRRQIWGMLVALAAVVMITA